MAPHGWTPPVPWAARRMRPLSLARSSSTPLESQHDDLRRCQRGEAHHRRDAHRRPHLPGGDRARRALELEQPPSRRAAPGAHPGLLNTAAMAIARDLREWIALLEREGELVRVATEVDPHLEVTEIVDRTVKAGGPALLFEHPRGSKLPLLINQFGAERRGGPAVGG